MTGYVRRINKFEARQLITQHSNYELEKILEVINSSTDMWAGYWDDKFVNAWGIVPDTLIGDSAHLWMFETPQLKDYPLAAAKHSKEIVGELLNTYPTLWGWTTKDSFRWLGWLGAKFTSVNEQYVKFEIRRD